MNPEGPAAGSPGGHDPQALAPMVSERLRQWASTLPPSLGQRFERLTAGSGVAADHGAAPYLSPLSQPVLLLPCWLARDPDPERLLDILGSGLAGYLHVRVQDDAIDEGTDDLGADLVLGSVLLTRHHHLVAPHVSRRYHDLALLRWTEYAEAMLFERTLALGTGVYDEAEFQRVLGRSRPLVLPGAAILDAEGRWDELPALETLVAAAVSAHQRFDDLCDVLADQQRGRRTPLLARSGAGDVPSLVRFLLSGGMDESIAVADAELEVVLEQARVLGLPAASLWVDARRSAMAAWKAALVERLVGAILTRLG